MKTDNAVGIKKNSKLDHPKEDKSLKKFSFPPNMTPIEKIKRNVHRIDIVSLIFFAWDEHKNRPVIIPRHMIIKTSIVI